MYNGNGSKGDPYDTSGNNSLSSKKLQNDRMGSVQLQNNLLSADNSINLDHNQNKVLNTYDLDINNFEFDGIDRSQSLALDQNGVNLVKLNKDQAEKSSFIRPQFRVQCKKWLYSNFGDYIEFEMVI